MRRIIICLLVLFIGYSASAQFLKKKKPAASAPKADSTVVKKDSTVAKKDSVTAPVEEAPVKFDYKSANQKAAEKNATNTNDASYPGSSSGSGENSNSTSTTTSGANSTTKIAGTKSKPAAKPKPMTAAEKKQAAEEAAAIEAATPKGIEALYYKFPIEYLPVVKDFMAFKESESPQDELHHVRIKDDISFRKQIIRFKDVDHGYMMLQKPDESKYTKMQVYKKKNGNLIMAIEQTDCPNNVCTGTLNFYTKTAGGWKDATDEFYPKIDQKFVISRLKSAYKKEYKDLELYNSHDYENNDANLKKAVTYQIAPEDGSIIIAEQNLPCKLYTMSWDTKKEKFELKKVEN